MYDYLYTIKHIPFDLQSFIELENNMKSAEYQFCKYMKIFYL